MNERSIVKNFARNGKGIFHRNINLTDYARAFLPRQYSIGDFTN